MSPTDDSSNHTVVWGVLRVIFTGVFPHEAVMLYALFVTHNCRDLKYVTTYTEQCNACACHAINSKNTLIIWNIGKLKTIDPSIHLLPLICGQISGLRHEAQISFFPATSFNSSGVIFETFPGQPEDKVSPVCHGSYLGSPPGGTCPDPISREMSRLHPDQMPKSPHLSPINTALFWASLSQMTELLTISQSESPDTVFGNVFFRSRPTSHEYRWG